MNKFSLIQETDGYVTLSDPTNTSPTLLVAGSKNVLIDANKKVSKRPGYSRLGAANTTLFNVQNSWRWKT